MPRQHEEGWRSVGGVNDVIEYPNKFFLASRSIRLRVSFPYSIDGQSLLRALATSCPIQTNHGEYWDYTSGRKRDTHSHSQQIRSDVRATHQGDQYQGSRSNITILYKLQISNNVLQEINMGFLVTDMLGRLWLNSNGSSILLAWSIIDEYQHVL